MKKIIALILALLCAFMIVACGDSENPPSSTSASNNTPETEDPNIPNVPPDSGTQLGPDDKDEPPVNPTKPTVESVMGELLGVFTAEDTFGNEGKYSTFTDYTDVNVKDLEGGKQYNIVSGGVYRLHGKSENGQIYIKAKDQNVILLLDGVNLKYAGSAPVIYAEDCSKVTIVLAEGSSNYLEDGSINGENGAIKVKSSDLVLDGKGKLTIKGNSKHAISNTKNLTINGGTYNITSVRHGVYGKLGVTVNGGKFTISSARSGFKSGDDEIGKEVEGNIVINACSALIRCNTNGINAYGAVEINNGRITVEALGKAVVATKDININGGTMIFNTTEDAIKSDTDINIAGTSNIKITTNGNGVECVNANVTTTGVIYIKTIPSFTEDVAGLYKKVDGEYVLLDGTEPAYVKRYTLRECKGFEIDEKIVVNAVNIGINSYEDCFNAKLIEVKSGDIVLVTRKDGMDASESVAISGTTNINVLSSDKGLKAADTVTLTSGNTTIVADTDAIKANIVSVVSGKHILFEKVEYVSSFTIRGGTFLSISTTNKPVEVRSTIPNASGTIVHKNLCVDGKQVAVLMGSAQVSVVLQKDFTEKMSVLFATENQGECTFIIGNNEKTETLTQGKFY